MFVLEEYRASILVRAVREVRQSAAEVCPKAQRCSRGSGRSGQTVKQGSRSGEAGKMLDDRERGGWF